MSKVKKKKVSNKFDTDVDTFDKQLLRKKFYELNS